MQLFTKVPLDSSSTGLPVSVSASATPGVLIHTAHATDLDEIWLYAQNNDTESITVTIEFGDASVSSNIVKTISAQDGLICLVPGLILTGSNTLSVFASASNVSVCGFVNRITEA